MVIKMKNLLILLTILVLSLDAFATNDSISIDQRWLNLQATSISKSGQWIGYSLYNPDDVNKNKIYILNTTNRNKFLISENYSILNNILPLEFINDFKAILQKGKCLSIIDLNNIEKTDSITNIKKHTIINDFDILITLDNEGLLTIDQFIQNKRNTITQIQNIDNFIISPNKQKLLYQIKNTHQLESLELNNLKKLHIGQVTANLYNPVWNQDQSELLLKVNSAKFELIDFNNHTIEEILLSVDSSKIVNENTVFYNNNDILFSYKIKTDSVINTQADFVDIWNANANDLHLKNLNYIPTFQTINKLFIYRTKKRVLDSVNIDDSLSVITFPITNTILSEKPFKYFDYTVSYPKKQYVLKKLDSSSTIAFEIDANSYNKLNPSLDYKHLIYQTNGKWEILNTQTFEKNQLDIDCNEDSSTYWTEDSSSIILTTDKAIYQYNLKHKTIKSLTSFDNQGRLSIKNSHRSGPITYIKQNIPLLFFFNDIDNKTSLLIYKKGIIKTIVNQTSNRINPLSLIYTNNLKKVLFTQENYNIPPELYCFESTTTTKIVDNYIPTHLYNWRKQKQITLKDSKGFKLTSTLYYPKNYDPNLSYPMVVHIYDIQKKDANIFDIPKLYTDNGLNISLLNEQGYFVLLPDTYTDDQGTGISSLNQVNLAVDSILSIEKTINPNKIGLKGHSFGAYKASFIATHTNKYSCVVSSSGVYDLIMFNYSYNYHLRKPNYSRVENHQWYLNKSFGQDPKKFLDNSPILYAQDLQTPILLWAGMQDINVPWEQTRHFYVALQRYNKPVIALFYKNINHVLDANIFKKNKQESIDILRRTFEWYDYFLKDKKDIDWINNGL